MPPDRFAQTAATTAPVVMPASAPQRVSRRQKRASSTTGPKEAPKPAQANETRLRMLSLACHAMMAATTETSMTATRPSRMERFSPSSLRLKA